MPGADEIPLKVFKNYSELHSKNGIIKVTNSKGERQSIVIGDYIHSGQFGTVKHAHCLSGDVYQSYVVKQITLVPYSEYMLEEKSFATPKLIRTHKTPLKKTKTPLKKPQAHSEFFLSPSLRGKNKSRFDISSQPSQKEKEAVSKRLFFEEPGERKEEKSSTKAPTDDFPSHLTGYLSYFDKKSLSLSKHLTEYQRFQMMSALEEYDYNCLFNGEGQGVALRKNDLEELYFYLVVPYIEGQNADKLCNDGFFASLSTNNLLSLLINLAKQLQDLHSFDIVHRDLKPSNILLDPVTHSARIIDFGLAIHQDNDLLPSKCFYFKPSHEDVPLDITRLVVDKTVDIWYLGYCMTLMLYPFYPNRERPLPLPKGAQKDLDNLLNKMMADNPSDRPSITEIIQKLEVIHSGLGQQAQLDQLLYETGSVINRLSQGRWTLFAPHEKMAMQVLYSPTEKLRYLTRTKFVQFFYQLHTTLEADGPPADRQKNFEKLIGDNEENLNVFPSYTKRVAQILPNILSPTPNARKQPPLVFFKPVPEPPKTRLKRLRQKQAIIENLLKCHPEIKEQVEIVVKSYFNSK